MVLGFMKVSAFFQKMNEDRRPEDLVLVLLCPPGLVFASSDGSDRTAVLI